MRDLLLSRAARITFAYAAFATVWILLSDVALRYLITDTDLFLRLSVVKGIAFVAATSVLLLLLMRRAFGALEASYASLRVKEAQRRVLTEERKALEAERLLAENAMRSERELSDIIIDSLPGILYLYDSDGRFLRWNQNFADISGYTDDEISRMHPRDFFREEDRPAVEGRIAAVFTDGSASVEAPFLAKDGTAAPFYLTGTRIEYDGMTCLVGMGIDISRRVAMEHALRDLNESLESSVAQRTAELHAALVRAESADRLKSAFLATMSHELRTPLNSIIGFTGIVLQGLAGPLTEEQTKQLGMVRGSARHLLELINDVLDISRIEAGQLNIHVEPLDLREAIGRAVDMVRPLADRKELAIEVDVEPPVGVIRSDRRRVDQVLLNLLNNAIKFTDAGCITVTAATDSATSADSVVPAVTELPADSAMPVDGGAPADAATAVVEIRIADTGIGMRPEDLATLFQPFSQIDSGLARQHEGTGLGLVICKRLVNLLGGDVRVESRLGEGSTFIVRLPVQPRSALQSAS